MAADNTNPDKTLNRGYNALSDPSIQPDHMVLSMAYAVVIRSIQKFGPSSNNIAPLRDVVNKTIL